jgi:predicted nucleic acid-binding protein
MSALFAPIDWLPLGEKQSLRAVEVQEQLADTTEGNHRRPAVDYLIAAIAEADEETVLWSFDKDLAIICEQTEQPHEAES